MTLPELLHNIKDHAEAITAIMFNNQATGDLRTRLLTHIVAEENGNQQALAQLMKSATLTPVEKRAVSLGIDHSRFLVDFISGKEITPAFAQELLHHFIEEHDQNLFGLTIAPQAGAAASPARPSSPTERAWTVGSLISRSIP